jgi:plasmid replication initiation protein
MIEGNNLIKRANELNQSYYKLKEVTQRVLAIAIEQAQDIERQTGENLILDGTKVVVCASYYAKVYGVDLNTAYDALKIAVKDMYYAEYVWQEMGKRGKMNQFRTRFVSHIGYLNGESSIEFVLTDMARQHIYNISKNFTIYEIKNLSNLGKYSIRLYELLAQWRSVGRAEYDLEDFRLKLGVEPTEYRLMANFKMRVLDFAVAEINQHTDFNVTYEQIKRGRSITGFRFKFNIKNSAQIGADLKRDPNTPDLFTHKTDKELAESNAVKQIKNLNKDDLKHQASAITSMIISNRLQERFTIGNETAMQMMQRIQSEITSQKIAEQWLNKLRDFGVGV